VVVEQKLKSSSSSLDLLYLSTKQHFSCCIEIIEDGWQYFRNWANVYENELGL